MGSYGELVSYSSGCVLLVLNALLSAKLVPVAYGIKKLLLAISFAISDTKVDAALSSPNRTGLDLSPTCQDKNSALEHNMHSNISTLDKVTSQYHTMKRGYYFLKCTKIAV